MRLVAGLGFRAGCEVASLRSALQAALELASAARGKPITIAGVAALATAADKADHPALLQLAAALQLPIYPVPLPTLATLHTTPSTHVPTRYGAHSVAEAAALAGAASIGAASMVIPARTPSVAPTRSIPTVRAEPVDALAPAEREQRFMPLLRPVLITQRCISYDRMATAALAAPGPGDMPLSVENTAP